MRERTKLEFEGEVGFGLSRLGCRVVSVEVGRKDSLRFWRLTYINKENVVCQADVHIDNDEHYLSKRVAVSLVKRVRTDTRGIQELRTIDMRTDSDCLRCCIATVLRLPYEAVPDFVRDHNRWAEEMARWAKDQGFSVVRVQCTGDGEMMHSIFQEADGLWIASGPAVRDRNHAVVFRGSEIAHDPHPSRDGLLSITAATVFSKSEGEQEVEDILSGE